MNLQEQISRIQSMMGVISEKLEDITKEINHYHGFVNMPNHWVDDYDKIYQDSFFDDKEYEDFYFDNFFDMDEMFGHPNSLFGTKGLPVGHPKRSSKSFDFYNDMYGPAIVRVIKNEKTSEMTEGEITEKCWKGYTQKGMKTMFGKRYPNCVKKKK